MRHRLVLVRHAKAEAAADSDASRELTERGQAQSSAVGTALAGKLRGNVHACVSSAERAVQTWRLASAGIGAEVTSEQMDALYTADADDLLSLVRSTDESIDTLVVVGHNPTVADVVSRLASDGSGAAYDALRTHGYSPSTSTVFDIDGAWSSLDSTSAELREYVGPQA